MDGPEALAAQREAQQQGDLLEEQQRETDAEVAEEILAVHPRQVTAGATPSPPPIPTALTQPVPHAYQHPVVVSPTTSDPRLQRAEQKHADSDRPSRRDRNTGGRSSGGSRSRSRSRQGPHSDGLHDIGCCITTLADCARPRCQR